MADREAQHDEPSPDTTPQVVLEWLDFTVMTNRDMSMLGEAQHKTVGGQGIVARLVDRHSRQRRQKERRTNG